METWHGFKKGERVKHANGGPGVVIGGRSGSVHVLLDDPSRHETDGRPYRSAMPSLLCREPKQPGVFKVGDRVREKGATSNPDGTVDEVRGSTMRMSWDGGPVGCKFWPMSDYEYA